MADEGAGAEPARAGAARARIARAALKIISTDLIVGLFVSSFKKIRQASSGTESSRSDSGED